MPVDYLHIKDIDIQYYKDCVSWEALDIVKVKQNKTFLAENDEEAGGTYTSGNLYLCSSHQHKD
jgi:hypothetical protein